MNRELADRWCERGILALVLAILVLGPLAIGGVGALGFLVIEGLTVGVLLLWGARLWLSPRPRFLWPPICWAVLAFTGYAVARALTADIEYVARQEMIHVLVYAFLFFAILNNLQRQEAAQIISFSLLFVAMAISAYAIFQFLTGYNYVWHFVKQYAGRGSGTFISPNNLAGFLEMLLPLGLAYTLMGRLKALTRVLLGYASLVICAGLAVTVSRGSWVATVLAMLCFFGLLLTHRNYRVPAFVLLVVLVVAGAVCLPRDLVIRTRVKQTLNAVGQVEDAGRFGLWQVAIRIWHDNPWWGAGPAHYDYRFRPYRPTNEQLRPELVHNDYLNTLADYGVAGVVLISAAWLLLGVGVTRTWRHVRSSPVDVGPQKGSNRFAFVLGALTGLMAILIHSVVDFNMHIPANAILAVALMALLSGCLRFASDRYWVGLGARAKGLASVVLLAGVAYLTLQGSRQGREYYWLERAAAQPAFSQPQIDALSRAFAAEPMNPETAYAIGEAFRVQSSEGADDSMSLAASAQQWFERCMKLNPWDSRGFLSCGLCLDTMGRQTESAFYFSRAEQLDPNGYFTLANIGMHYAGLGEYAAAKPWLERSLRLQGPDNRIALSYLALCKDRLSEAATNEISARLIFQPK